MTPELHEQIAEAHYLVGKALEILIRNDAGGLQSIREARERTVEAHNTIGRVLDGNPVSDN